MSVIGEAFVAVTPITAGFGPAVAASVEGANLGSVGAEA